MFRLTFLMKLFRLTLVASLFSAAGSLAVAEESSARRNVVFILIDDLGHYGISAYGSTKLGFGKDPAHDVELRTPHIDRLAAEGLRCDNAFAYPLCEPTRIALMSGKRNQRNLLRRKAQHASDITFSDLFKKAGYVTGITGKWKQSRGTKEIPAKDYLREFGWDEFCCFDLVKQGNRFFSPSLVINGEIRQFGNDIDPATGRRWFGPDICNRFALDFIERHQAEPFFLYYPLTLVHREDEGSYMVPSPETKPQSLFDEFDDDFQAPLGNNRATRKFFPEMIRYTDTLVGRVVEKLEKLGLRENTLIVLMGDNGTQIPFVHVLADGTRYEGRKGATTDHGMHVPLIFSQPGTIPAGSTDVLRTYKGLVDVVDIHPTLCEAAGISLPNARDIDGLSFWSQVMGNQEHHRDEIYTYYPEPNLKKSAEPVILEFAFDGRFKRYAPHPGYPKGRFFDTQEDSLEQGGAHRLKGPNFGIIYHSGLDLDKLSAEEERAFARLGASIQSERQVAVEGIAIETVTPRLKAGSRKTLSACISPEGATRNNIIWESNDPSIASIDKFGVLTAQKPGKVIISVYSWDDADPRADNHATTFLRDGLSDSLMITVR